MKSILFAALVSALGASTCPAGARAQDAPSQVTVSGVHNDADLSYAVFLRSFGQLSALLPPEPRHIDLVDRILFSRLDPTDQDQFTSATWAISIMSASRDIEVPIQRGGYFVLPVDRVAMRENAKIIFNTHTRDGVLGLAIRMRTQPGAVIHAAALAAALREANRFLHNAKGTPMYRGPAHVDAVKACFGSPSDDMIVTGGAGTKRSAGMCKLYVPAASDVDTNADISFSTAPDIVVLLPDQP